MANEAMKDVEQDSGEQKAKDKMQQVFQPKAEELKDGGKKYEQGNLDHSPDEEAKRTDDGARADIIAFYKQGKKFDASVPGVDKDTLKQVKDALKKLPDENMATKQMEVDVDGKTFYFVAVADKINNRVNYFYKSADQFDPSARTFLREVDDKTYEKLTGKKREKKADA
jgi:hypothetical protein